MCSLRSWSFGIAAVCLIGLMLAIGCRRDHKPMVAVIPRTTALILWEAEHAGAETAAHREGLTVYWNAPTREDDVERQISLIQRVVAAGARGLVLAPDQALALMVPVPLVSVPIHVGRGRRPG